MVDSWMPDVEVHIAFNAGYNTPAASRTWTDVSSYVELADRINIAFGRQDERATADANSLSLTLDNTDGRFTANRAASPYYPNVKIGRPIRVRVTPPGGSVSTRFIGFIDEWPVEWEGTDSYAKAPIRASSRLARLGLSAKLRSVIEQTIVDTAPTAYWTMGDPSGSTTASESSGNNKPPLSVVGSGPPVTFGSATGPGVDGLTAASFANGQYLSANIETGGCAAIRFALQVSVAPASSTRVAQVLGNDGDLVDLNLFATGSPGAGQPVTLLADFGAAGTVSGGVFAADDAVHDVVLIHVPSSSHWRMYVDGVNTASGGPAAAFAHSTTTLSLGGFVVGLTGSISHAAMYSTTLDPATIPTVQQAVATGFAGDRTDQRLLRLLAWAGVAAAEVTTETGVETMTYQLTSGQSVVDALRDVESTESGVLFDGRDGTVTFHNRSHRYLKTASATLNMASQHVGADYSPKLDRSALVNDASVSNPTTGESARSVSTTSSDEYGIATTSATSVADSYEPLQQKAAWLVGSYAEPRNRVPSLTVDVLAHQGLTPSAQTLLGITVGDVLAVSNAPTQSDSTAPSYFVEGGTEVIGPESYEITFNLSPTYPTLSTFMIGDATRGQIETGGVLAL